MTLRRYTWIWAPGGVLLSTIDPNGLWVSRMAAEAKIAELQFLLSSALDALKTNQPPNRTAWRKGVKRQVGTANNAAKLTEHAVHLIRSRRQYTVVEEARIWDVSESTISRARAGKTWKHVA